MTYSEESYKKTLRTQIETYKQRYPGITDEEALNMRREDLKARASQGGKNGKTEGFAHGKFDPSEAGSKKWNKEDKHE